MRPTTMIRTAIALGAISVTAIGVGTHVTPASAQRPKTLPALALAVTRAEVEQDRATFVRLAYGATGDLAVQSARALAQQDQADHTTPVKGARYQVIAQWSEQPDMRIRVQVTGPVIEVYEWIFSPFEGEWRVTSVDLNPG